jgi:hypothetical protein
LKNEATLFYWCSQTKINPEERATASKQHISCVALKHLKKSLSNEKLSRLIAIMYSVILQRYTN